MSNKNGRRCENFFFLSTFWKYRINMQLNLQLLGIFRILKFFRSKLWNFYEPMMSDFYGFKIDFIFPCKKYSPLMSLE
jgi:hypothetical protein